MSGECCEGGKDYFFRAVRYLSFRYVGSPARMCAGEPLFYRFVRNEPLILNTLYTSDLGTANSLYRLCLDSEAWHT